MRMIHWDPFHDLMTRHDAEDPTDWSPAVDAIEIEGNLVLAVDIPGVSRNEIEIQVEGGELSIRGKRVLPGDESEGSIHRRERASGKFERIFVLPENLIIGEIDARYKDGVLTITLPVAEEAKPRRVEIHAA